MSQKTSGLYRLTQIPAAYEWLQDVLGAARSRRELVDTYVRPRPGDRVLDLGCGPASILPLLGEVDYVGIDLNPRHIEQARAASPDRGTFLVKSSAELNVDEMGPFDLVCCFGLLHHLEDQEAAELARHARAALKPSGRLVAVDPVFEEGQHWIARRLAQADSGQCVRQASAYKALIESAFSSCETHVRHDLLRIPYSHCINIAQAPVP